MKFSPHFSVSCGNNLAICWCVGRNISALNGFSLMITVFIWTRKLLSILSNIIAKLHRSSAVVSRDDAKSVYLFCDAVQSAHQQFLLSILYAMALSNREFFWMFLTAGSASLWLKASKLSDPIILLLV